MTLVVQDGIWSQSIPREFQSQKEEMREEFPEFCEYNDVLILLVR